MSQPQVISLKCLVEDEEVEAGQADLTLIFRRLTHLLRGLMICTDVQMRRNVGSDRQRYGRVPNRSNRTAFRRTRSCQAVASV
jgi:hypothetical protein